MEDQDSGGKKDDMAGEQPNQYKRTELNEGTLP